MSEAFIYLTIRSLTHRRHAQDFERVERDRLSLDAARALHNNGESQPTES